MKRLGNAFERIVSLENLQAALDKAARGKHGLDVVRRCLSRRDERMELLRGILLSGTYRTGVYHRKVLHEPKERTIYALPFFPDRVCHHAVMNVLEPYWDARLIADSYSCRKGMGPLKGSIRCMEHVRRHGYVLQCDVSKFYLSIDHAVLKALLRRKIKDERLLALLDEIIDSANRIPGAEPGRNAPIGNLLSQWFGNIYLGELDAFVKQECHVGPYIRYCDDFLLFSDSKAHLRRLKDEITVFLKERLRLTLSKAKLYPVTRGVDFLGYRHFPRIGAHAAYILVRKRTAKKIKRFCRRFLEGAYAGTAMRRLQGRAAAAHGLLKHANAHHLRESTRLAEVMAAVGVRPR